MRRIVGLDLSLTCTGFVAAPVEWAGDWGKVIARELQAPALPPLVRGETREVSEVARTWRISVLARGIALACYQADASHVVIEQRAFSQHTAASGQNAALAEIVKFLLWSDGVPFSCVPVSEARKLLLGKVPRNGKDAKNAVQATFRAAGCPVEWGQDITDAMCVLNYAMSVVEGRFFAS